MEYTDVFAIAQRTDSGALDLDYYRVQAQRLRARALRHGARRIVLGLRRSWIALQQYRARREAQRALCAMNRRELFDIGLTPADIHAIQSGAYFTDATRRHREWPQTAANDTEWMARPAPGVRA